VLGFLHRVVFTELADHEWRKLARKLLMYVFRLQSDHPSELAFGCSNSVSQDSLFRRTASASCCFLAYNLSAHRNILQFQFQFQFKFQFSFYSSFLDQGSVFVCSTIHRLPNIDISCRRCFPPKFLAQELLILKPANFVKAWEDVEHEPGDCGGPRGRRGDIRWTIA
jgi:hypothetical protein